MWLTVSKFLNHFKILNNKWHIEPYAVVFKNHLHKDICRIFYPFNLMLKLQFASKYCIKDGCITTNGVTSYILAFLVFSFIIPAHLIVYISTTDITQSYVSIIFPTFRCIGLIITFILSIVHRCNNVLLVLIIQDIHRCIDISKAICNIIIWNWITVFSAVFGDMFIYVVFYNAFTRFSYSSAFCEAFFACIDVDLVYGIRILVLLMKYLDAWTVEVLSMSVNEGIGKGYCVLLLKNYRNILKAFNIYKKLSQVMVLVRTINAFGRNLAHLQNTIQMLKMKTLLQRTPFLYPDWIYCAMTSVWIMKYLTVITLQSVYCEKFYIAVEKAEAACIQRMMNVNCSKNHRRLFKTVLRETRSSSVKMRACGLFNVDVILPLSIMGLFAHYSFILLQFAFL